MTDETSQDVTKCPRCGSPWLFDEDGECPERWWEDRNIHNVPDCNYAAGLRQDWATLYGAYQLMTTVADDWQERADLSAEAERKALKRAERAEAERDVARKEGLHWIGEADRFRRERDEWKAQADRQRERVDGMRERAEQAEALLRELAVAALAVPVDLGRRLDEYREAGNE